MIPMGTPQPPWPPNSALRDCSQGYCSYYCPQWCYFLFPPPPPTPPSTTSLSPLLISIVSTAFLLAAYYLILVKFRRHFRTGTPLSPDRAPAVPASASGLDDALIAKIASCEYRPRDGAATECAVCLGRFERGERLRLLPRCAHAFHLCCIDTWLRARSTCPLCRAGVLPVAETASAVEEEAGSPRRQIIIGRSLSMGSPFPRQVVAGDNGGGSARWTRALRCVGSPVRMKRSGSACARMSTAVLPV